MSNEREERIIAEKLFLQQNPSYGHTLTSAEKLKPATGVRLVHAQVDVDLPKFTKMFVDLMSAPARVRTSR